MISDGAEATGGGARMGVVLGLGDPDRHFWLARSVARVMGVDLGAALARGDLPCEDYRAMVNRCRTCPLVVACESWLAASGGRAETPPPGCLISGDLTQLKRRFPNKGAH
ncbi:MAG: DUF6455 family protein [Paracoccaceae bacterium]|nr:DUF6455 family protein [Paracoccaceae bacterium]